MTTSTSPTPGTGIKKGVLWPLVLASLLMVGGVLASEAMRPRHSLADSKPALVLDKLVPPHFGDWKEVPSLRPVLPDPTVQAVLDSAYSQVLARVYQDSKGQMVMLTIAYGKDQNSESTAAHRPEFCYTGQGFTVKDQGTHQTTMGDGHQLTMRQLVGYRDTYVEPISYWVTLDEKATLPGLGRKMAQLAYGLRGQIADGMLVRVSTGSKDPESAYLVHERFIHDMEKQVPPEFRARFFGS